MSKRVMSIVNTQLTLLVTWWLLEVDVRNPRKLDQNLKEKKQLENQESLGNVLEQKWENNMLEKNKIKSKKPKRLKNENSFLKMKP